jgi:hypothetical protein
MKLIAASLLVGLAYSAALAAPNPTELRIADVPWHLELSLGDMKPIEGFPSRPDRDAFTYQNANAILSVIVENAHVPATLDSCRDVFARRKTGMGAINEVQGQRGDAATQEFDLKTEFQGRTIVQHNIFSCRVRGTYYVDTHVSKIAYVPADRPALMALIDGVKIVE